MNEWKEVMNDYKSKYGRIVSFNAMDGTGFIELEDGDRVQFAYSSLDDVDPTHLGPVEISGVREGAAGPLAARVAKAGSERGLSD